MKKAEKPVVIQVQNFLGKRYQFRYNEVLGRTEFQFADRLAEGYQVLTDYDLNSIHLDLAENNYSFSLDSLRKLLNSKYVQRYNPFHEYFKSLPAWDGTTDYIEMLASTVNTTNNDLFKLTFKKWIIAMTASLMDDKIINHTFLIFTGGQGIGKTTWINNLVPKQLNEYYYAGAINPNHPDGRIQLAENMMINVDELQGMTKKSVEDLKAVVTMRDIKTRRPYASIHESLPHRASFAGSVNGTDFLSDTTGNRRFLCFEVTEIEYEHGISMDDVFAQTLHLFRNGFRFYLNREEIEQLNKHNESFIQRTMEEDTLLKCLEPCDENDEYAIWGTTTDILNELAFYEPKLKSNNSSLQQLGRLLNKHKFKRVKKVNYGYYYKIKPDLLGYGYVVQSK